MMFRLKTVGKGPHDLAQGEELVETVRRVSLRYAG